MSYFDSQDMGKYSKFVNSLHDLGEILKKPLNKRTNSDNNLITSALEKIPFFKNYTTMFDQERSLLSTLTPVFKVEHYPARSVLSHHGNLVDKFFVIIEGNVRKYVPREHEDIEKELRARYILHAANTVTINQPQASIDIQDPTLLRRSNTILNIDASRTMAKALTLPGSFTSRAFDQEQDIYNAILNKQQSIVKQDQPLSQQEIESKVYEITGEEVQFFRSLRMSQKYFVETLLRFRRVKGLITGDYFGDIAMASHVPNDATLVAWDDVYIASIEKKDYERVFKSMIDDTQDKIDFLMPNLLPGFSSKTAINFIYNFKKEIYHVGEVIFKEGAKAEGFWMIKEGEIELFRTLDFQDKKKGAGLVETEESSHKKRKHKALIVRLSAGQLLGEEIIVGINERIFTAVSKASSSTLYFLETKYLHKNDETGKEVIKYLAAQTKISMEGKLKRLNSALMEANIVLSLPRNSDAGINVGARSKAKQTIDHLLTEFQGSEKEKEERDSTQLNTKTMLKPEHNPQEAAEWENLERLANLKYKLVLEKAKIDPKLLGDKNVDKKMEKKGYYESPDKLREFDFKEKKFYYPSSLFDHCIQNDKHLLKKKELQSKLRKNQQSLGAASELPKMAKKYLNINESAKVNSNSPRKLNLRSSTEFMVDFTRSPTNLADTSGRAKSYYSQDYPDLSELSPVYRLNTEKIERKKEFSATLSQKEIVNVSSGDSPLPYYTPKVLSSRLEEIDKQYSGTSSLFSPKEKVASTNFSGSIINKTSLPTLVPTGKEPFSPMAKKEKFGKINLERSLHAVLDSALKSETMRGERESSLNKKDFKKADVDNIKLGSPLSVRDSVRKSHQPKNKTEKIVHHLMKSMFDSSQNKEVAPDFMIGVRQNKEDIEASPRDLKLPNLGKKAVFSPRKISAKLKEKSENDYLSKLEKHELLLKY